MALWSIKRRLIYGASFLSVVLLVVVGVSFSLFYGVPTCTDGAQNGDELGIDCGGSCKKLCTSDTLTPVVVWAKTFNISGDVYSAVAYVENPNINSKNPRANYNFRVYDADNKLITVKDGHASIPKGRKFAIFETGIILKNAKPKSTDFKFTSFETWEKDTEKEPSLSITHSSLLATTSAPRVEGTITNNSLTPASPLELTAFIIDNKENVVAASHTFLDGLASRETQDFVFTWPRPFSLGAEACTNSLDVAIALDRSASMASESANTVEPWNTVQSSTIDFIRKLTDSDQVSVISFDINAIEESSLSADKDSSISAINHISLGTNISGLNITDGLQKASEELFGSMARQGSHKVLVLLTDSTPTEPKRADIPEYTFTSAQAVARSMAQKGVAVYTIGLGKNINSDFLKSLATSNPNYFSAPNKSYLQDAYSSILSNICTKKPSLINVIYRPI